MTEPLKLLRQQGMSELACQFAAMIERKEQGEHPVISLAAALLTEAIAQGHVCLNLADLPEITEPVSELLPDSMEQWLPALKAGKSVGQPGDYKPMILTETGMLYLYRYWLDEADVAKAIKARLHAVEDLNSDQLNQDLMDWHNPIIGIDWQKVAVAVALTRQFAVISGGPGTGKTTIVLKILQCLYKQSESIRVGLAAPTGKAAARLQQAISKQQNIEVKTLHRLLGISEHNDQGRYHAQRLLALDVLIIDEASMIDISLMAKLMRAMPAKARLILLGDSQQLASVESGAVFANLSEAEQGLFSNQFIQQFPALGLEADQTALFQTGENHQSDTLFSDSFVRLQHSYRFDKDSLIGELAALFNAGNSDNAIRLLQTQSEAVWLPADEQSVMNALANGYHTFINAVENEANPRQILQTFDEFRVLAALKQGPQSVSSVNRMMLRFLARRGWHTAQNYFVGRPIMITRNDYRQQLFNGDIGVILRDKEGQLKACFYFGEELRWLGLNRLPAHETVFAMTVHKSQGSEFDAVTILLPDEISPILNRELLYTAITRARKKIHILSSEPVLRHSIQHRHQRESGLKNQLGK